ncbi:unnamed protein product [Lymnaea stagnalis]|uniref:TNFR-Cys domain-containing protein n=1 Tax=Lymnaea stagnalis TaxID=6523 RepID=A0AAV2I299_LYMST
MDPKTSLLIFSFLAIGTSCHYVCHRGQYLNSSRPRRCLPCQEGTYMIDDNHANINCFPCSHAKVYLHEITIKNCTKTSNTVIGCKNNYFREHLNVDYSDCTICTDCAGRNMYVARRCAERSDTVCCPKPGMALNDTRCVETSRFVCHRGQRLEHGNSDQPSCVDCMPGFFLPHDNHQNVECVKCKFPDQASHQILIKECNTTMDTIIGCADGYFSNEGKCERCSSCISRRRAERHTARLCSETDNTACCPWPGMMLVTSVRNGGTNCAFGYQRIKKTHLKTNRIN